MAVELAHESLMSIVLAHRHRNSGRDGRHGRRRSPCWPSGSAIDARAHAERITPNVLAALADAGLAMADLGAVVVGCGPGPFTGLRVGMATAAAYGHALGIPVYGVCSLDAIGGLTTGDTLVVTDARRREVYWARYRDGVRIDGPAVSAPADVDPGPRARWPARPTTPRCSACRASSRSIPRAAGLVAAVADWSTAAGAGAAVSASAGRQDHRRAGGGEAMTACSEPVTIGALTVDDADRCAELESLLFPGDDPWPTAAFVRELAAEHNHYVAARTAADGDTLADRLRRHLAAGSHAAVRVRNPHHRRRPGVSGPRHRPPAAGRAAELAAGAVVHLEVRTDNAPAIALYRSVGFTEVGLRRRYYRISGADAYTMRREAL